ncbi:hypothetical protein FIV42_16850 [Persicimonas caeni]|uniref:WD40 repeat domain-containing protein n=1 Tax=Persicimonas caeni TaxID=2292766 RepID=A0A4Y6PWF7_PERCE|nr:WD40 repeat domain-containing protein [Persicimonas caeni]QDG52347.1 hypothetical protein FIV42_16850 [Persicimonas caeni]QED33569.1 hypothetical protein FRD00_16845 [Persicimonas caeni]
MSMSDASATPAFVDWHELSTDLSPAELQAAIDAADWEHFVAARDLPELRARLERLAETDGVGELHHACTAAIRARGAQLRPRFRHTEPFVAYALSPDGEHLAVGTWVGADYNAGGTLQIWEVATGRLVNVLDGVDGGVGWPGYANCIQWSPDGSRVGAAFSTNAVGDFAPFGARNEPGTWVAVTHGWSRPPAWCWRPDGQAVAVGCWGPSAVPGCIAEFQTDHVYEDDAGWFADELGEPIVEALTLEDGDVEEIQPQEFLQFSPEGTHLFGHNGHLQAYAIDVASGDIEWLSTVGRHVAWRPDGAVFAHDLTGLVFYDADSGLPTSQMPMHMGGSELSWAPGADSRLLAMVVEPDNQFGADPGVHLYDDGEYLGSVDLAPGAPGDIWDFEDAKLWAWAPGGKRAACLTAQATVEVFAVGAEPEHLATLEVDEPTAGILWGANDTIVCVGKEHLAFWDLARATQRSDDETWWVVDRRFAWPTQWDEAPAGEAVPFDGHQPAEPDEPAELDLGSEATLDDIFSVHRESLGGLGAGWRSHTADHHREVAVMLAERGEVEAARQAAESAATDHGFVAANADIAVIFARNGHTEAAQTALATAEMFAEHGIEGWATTFAYAPLAAANHVLGNEARADELFEMARENIEQEANAFQRYLALARGYLAMGDYDAADAAILEGPWDSGWLNHFLSAYLVDLARHGEFDRLDSMLDRCEAAGMNISEFRLADGIVDALIDAEQYERAWQLLARFDGLSVTHYREQIVTAMLENGHREDSIELSARYLDENREYVGMLLDWAELLVRLDERGADALAVELEERVDEILAAWKPADALQKWGALASATGRTVEALAIVDEFDDETNQFAALCGLGSTHEEGLEREKLFERAELLLDILGGDELAHVLRLAKAAHRAGDAARHERLFGRATALATDGTRDKRFALSDLQDAQISVGDLAAAYETLREQTPTNRRYEMDTLLDACAQAGEYGAVRQLLEQLPAEDLNDRTQHALRALRMATCGRNYGPCW